MAFYSRWESDYLAHSGLPAIQLYTDHVNCQPQSSVNNPLNWYSQHTQLTPLLTLDWHRCQQSVRNQLIFNWCIYESVGTEPTIDRLLIKCGLSVNQVSITLSIKYRSRSQSRVSTESIHRHSTMIPIFHIEVKWCFSHHPFLTKTVCLWCLISDKIRSD